MSQLAGLIDWATIDRHLVGISASAKGEPGWPPLALLQALLLAIWHDLSDVKLAEALDDRAGFRRLCGFAADQPIPERTVFVRFRRELVRRGLPRTLFDAVTRQLEAKGVMVRTGTRVDATLIPSAGISGDGEARRAGHRRRKPVPGCKAHVATDQAAVLIRGVKVTTANVHDADQMRVVLLPEPGDVYGDCAFAGRSTERVIRERGGTPQVVRAGTLGSQEALARSRHTTLGCGPSLRIKKVFGTWKRNYGVRRVHWIGLAKAGLQVRLAAVACNLRRTDTLISAAA